MPLNAHVKGGTHAGVRKPFEEGIHGPKCVCSQCAQRKESKR